MTTTATTGPAAVPPDDPDPVVDVDLDDKKPAAAEPAGPTPKGKVAAAAAAMGEDVRNWSGIVRRPMSVREAWRRSFDEDARRIPDGSNLLGAIWWAMNRTERLLLFAVLLVLVIAAATLLWCVQRPMRRLGLYAVVVIVFVIVPAVAKG